MCAHHFWTPKSGRLAARFALIGVQLTTGRAEPSALLTISLAGPVYGDLSVTTLRCALRKYVVATDEQTDAIVFWILHTWLVNDFACSPRLGIGSPTKGCGKTTNRVVRRPKRAGSISPPALFDSWRCTSRRCCSTKTKNTSNRAATCMRC